MDNGKTPMINKHRVRVVRVPQSRMLFVMTQGWAESVQVVRMPVMKLPDKTRVLSLYYEAERNCFAFVIQNDTFEEVEEGTKVPEHRLEWKDIEVNKVLPPQSVTH